MMPTDADRYGEGPIYGARLGREITAQIAAPSVLPCLPAARAMRDPLWLGSLALGAPSALCLRALGAPILRAPRADFARSAGYLCALRAPALRRLSPPLRGALWVGLACSRMA